MVSIGNLFKSKLNENSLINIIKSDLTKIDTSMQNFVQDNESEFTDAIHTVLATVGNERRPLNVGDIISFNFKVGRGNVSNSEVNKIDFKLGAGKDIGCYAPARYFYKFENDSYLPNQLDDAKTQKQFIDELRKNLASTFPVKDITVDTARNFVFVELDYIVYAKQFAYYFSRLAISYLAKSKINAKAVPLRNGVQIVIEVE